MLRRNFTASVDWIFSISRILNLKQTLIFPLHKYSSCVTQSKDLKIICKNWYKSYNRVHKSPRNLKLRTLLLYFLCHFVLGLQKIGTFLPTFLCSGFFSRNFFPVTFLHRFSVNMSSKCVLHILSSWVISGLNIPKSRN